MQTSTRRETNWVPALAAPLAVLGHIVSETLASGRNLLAVAGEPSHFVMLVLALAAMPLWFRAAAARRLGETMFVFVAVSLLVEGNGLGAAALLTALAISALISWLSGLAICAAIRPNSGGVPIGALPRVVAALPPAVDLVGPYYAFVSSRGNRPPPVLLG
jgi:hypothetical protein